MHTEKDAEDFIIAMMKADKNATYSFAITYDDKAIGSIAVFRKENIHRLTGELAYFVAEPFWGKGITTSAIRMICKYIFENTDIVRIFATPFESNIASCRVLEKSGFHIEGVLRHNAIKNGQIIDMKMYSNCRS